MSPYQNQIVDYLKNIIKTDPNSIKALVAKEAIEYPTEDIPTFLNDLMEYGCESGIASCMIYYRDTHQFFDTHYNEIENIRYDFEDCFGHPLTVVGDLKNFYAWLAFEQTAIKLAGEIDEAL